MTLYYWLKNIFNTLLPITLIISLITGIKEKGIIEKTDTGNLPYKNNESKWQERIKFLLAVFSGVIIIGLLLFIWIKIKIYWILWIFSVPVYLERLVGAYLSIGIVGNVVKSNSKDKLTMQEYVAIETLAYVLWFVGICNGFERIVEKVTAFSNVIVSDILLMILYITIVFIYVFLICALLPVSLFFCLNIFKWINKYLPGKEKLRKYGNIFVQKIENPFKPKSFLIVLIKFIRHKSGINKVMGCILIPVTFMLDVIISVLLAICSIVFSAIGYVFLLGRLIKKTIKRILNRLLSLSDKRVVSASFRIALIISLTCTVVFNRYQPFLKLYEESTTVLEFVASSIIIPVVFEWIYSFKNKTFS